MLKLYNQVLVVARPRMILATPDDRRMIPYGYGWGFPCCWQGWVVRIAYLLFVFGGSYIIDLSLHSGLYLGYVISLSILLCVVCWMKGEKPAWRWGKKGNSR